MHPDDALRPPRRRTENGYRDRGGVAGKNRSLRALLVERAKDRELGFEMFARRLDCQIDVEPFERRRGDDPLEDLGPRIGVDAPLLDAAIEVFGNAGDAASDELGGSIVQPNGVAARGRHLRDARTHLAGTDDGDFQGNVIFSLRDDQPTRTRSASP